MDIIQHLRRIITPVVINEQTQTHLNTETSTKDDLLDEVLCVDVCQIK